MCLGGIYPGEYVKGYVPQKYLQLHSVWIPARSVVEVAVSR